MVLSDHKPQAFPGLPAKAWGGSLSVPGFKIWPPWLGRYTQTDT